MTSTSATGDVREPAHQVSPRAVAKWTTSALLGALVPLAALVGWWVSDDAPDRTWHWVATAVWFVATAAYVVVMPRWRYRVHRWESTDTAVYTQSGWLSQERRIAPINRVQTVDLKRGPLEQAFRLATVTVTTASAAGPLRIEALDAAVATTLVAQLTAAAEADTGDAT